MEHEIKLFISSFTTLLAVVNPLEAMPVFLLLLRGKDEAAHHQVAFRSCVYTTALMLFFLLFGTLVMRFFGVPLSMVRIAGGIVLTRIGFELFTPSRSESGSALSNADPNANIAFMPLAMPVMFGPGVLATVIGMASSAKGAPGELRALAPIVLAILATTFVTWLSLVFANRIARTLGVMGIDAATRIVGFFIAAMGVGLVFDGVIEAIGSLGFAPHP